MATESAIIIGGGRVGLSLGFLAEAAGYRVSAVLVKADAARAAAHFPLALVEAAVIEGGGVVSEPFKQQLREASLFIFAVPDSVLEEAVTLVAKFLPDSPTVTSSVAFHTAGARSESVLSALQAKGVATAVLHPCFPFFSVLMELPEPTVFTYSGDATALVVAQRLTSARKLGLINLPAFESTPGARELYHASNVLCAGHVATLLSAAAQSLAVVGIGKEQARQIMLSLLSGEIALLESSLEIEAGITGPFMRGDDSTITKQVEQLRRISPQLGELYATVGRISCGLQQERKNAPSSSSDE